MKGFRLAALAAALIVTAGVLPQSAAQGQSRASLVRAFDFARGSRIGVSVHDVEEADAKDTKQAKAGVVVETVEPGGPADKAGVKAGDAITEFDGERVRSVRQFSRLVQETPSGRSVSVALARAGQRITVTVAPERSSDDDLTMRRSTWRDRRRRHRRRRPRRRCRACCPPRRCPSRASATSLAAASA